MAGHKWNQIPLGLGVKWAQPAAATYCAGEPHGPEARQEGRYLLFLADSPAPVATRGTEGGLVNTQRAMPPVGCMHCGVMWSWGPQDTVTPQSSTALASGEFEKEEKYLGKEQALLAGPGVSGSTLKSPGDSEGMTHSWAEWLLRLDGMREVLSSSLSRYRSTWWWEPDLCRAAGRGWGWTGTGQAGH